MIIDEITVLTCSYNNNLLTKCMIMSLFKVVGRYVPVCIMDNGNKEICSGEMKEVFTVIDNTNFKITPNFNQVSKNHCAALDWALKNVIKTKYVLICDNDVLLKPSVLKLLEEKDVDCIGEIGHDFADGDRIFPYFCIINLQKMKNENISYFVEKSFVEDKKHNIIRNDTGWSFYNSIKNKWKIKNISLNDYIVHLGGASHRPLQKRETWLNENKKLFSFG